MSDADKLSAPSYEPFDAGVADRRRPGRDGARRAAHRRPTSSSYIDDYDAGVPARRHLHDARGGARRARWHRRGAAVASPRRPGWRPTRTPGLTSPIAVSRSRYVVASTDRPDGRARTSSAAGTTHYQAAAALRGYLAANPGRAAAAPGRPTRTRLAA